MKRFIYPSPFPTPPQEGTLQEGETALGPFTLAEAVRVFWSLKRLDLDMTVSATYSVNGELRAQVNEHYNDLYINPQTCAAQEPYFRILPKTMFLEMMRTDTAPQHGFSVGYPVMLPQSSPTNDYALRQFIFPLQIYFGTDMLLLSSSACYGDEYLLQLYATVPITILGKTTEIFLLVNRTLIETPDNVQATYSANATITPVFDDTPPEGGG